MRISTWMGLVLAAGLVWVMVDGAKTLKERPARLAALAPAQEPVQPATAPAPVRAMQPPPVPRGTTVVLPGALAGDLASQCSRWPPAVQGGWDLPNEVVAQLETDFPRIADLVAERCCEDGARIADPGAFHRQIAGVVHDGRQLVYVNAVGTHAPEPSWLVEPVRVCDGGASFWGVLYDPQTREFSDLAVNGRG